MKTKIFALLTVAVLVLAISPVAFASTPDQILERYSAEEINDGMPTSMEEFNSLVTKEEIETLIVAEKAKDAPSTYAYTSLAATDEEVASVYAEVRGIIMESYPGNYYFRDMYWQMRNGYTTLSLDPSANMDGFLSLGQAAIAWSAVKGTCGASQYWSNESGLKDQFDCHALGEVFLEVGTWDLEVERPAVGYLLTVINSCNP